MSICQTIISCYTPPQSSQGSRHCTHRPESVVEVPQSSEEREEFLDIEISSIKVNIKAIDRPLVVVCGDGFLALHSALFRRVDRLMRLLVVTINPCLPRIVYILTKEPCALRIWGSITILRHE